jgi:hypothetical protein
LRALASRVDAQLATVVDDGTLSVAGGAGHGAVRTIVFESDHRCEVVVRTGSGGELSVELQTEPGDAFDIELSETLAEGQQAQVRSAEPALFDSVTPGPIRLVYSLPGAAKQVRRYQTEWVLIR